MRRKLKQKALPSRKGMTLTEVVIASTLLLVALVPMLKGLTASHFTSVMIEQKTRSLTLAQAKMEEVKIGSINNYSGSFSASDIALDAGYRCDVSDTPDGSNLRVITVSVGFDDDSDNTLDAAEVDIELSTKIARRN